MIFTMEGMKLESLANKREHWSKKSRRAKEQRARAKMYTFSELAVKDIRPSDADIGPMRVRITRLGPRKLDSDNLAISAKHVRDGIADALGVDDGDEQLVTWFYDQEKSKEYSVKVEIQ